MTQSIGSFVGLFIGSCLFLLCISLFAAWGFKWYLLVGFFYGVYLVFLNIQNTGFGSEDDLHIRWIK